MILLSHLQVKVWGPLNESRRTSRIVIRTIICKEKKFNLDKFLQQFNTLDMNNYGSWPISVKITCWIFIFFAVLALGYFIVIQPKLQAIDNAQAQESNLLNEFREKTRNYVTCNSIRCNFKRCRQISTSN